MPDNPPDDLDASFTVNPVSTRAKLETAMFEASDNMTRFKSAVKTAAIGVTVGTVAAVTAPIWVPVATAAATAAVTVAVVTAPVTVPMAYGAVKLAEVTSASLEAKAETKFRAANSDMIDALKQPMAGGLTDQNPQVRDLLEKHINGSATAMNVNEAMEMAAIGEHICKAVADGKTIGPNGLEVDLPDGGSVHVPPGNFAAKAVSWHLMAAAAQADIARENLPGNPRSDMTNSGTFILKDPGNKLYEFLNANPMVMNRASTHFEERLDHDKHIPLAGNTLQKGCDDYQNKFPGGGGALLFDKLKGGEIFVKFEHAGTPSLIAHEAGDGKMLRANRAALAAERWVEHSFSFLESLKATTGDPTKVVRQEHTYKGEMKNAVHDPYIKLVNAAKDAGLITKNEAKAMAAHAKSHGLPSIAAGMEIIDERRKTAVSISSAADSKLAFATKTLADNIKYKVESMGQGNNDLGIERRGGEVHLDANPNNYLRGSANAVAGPVPPKLPDVAFPERPVPAAIDLPDISIQPEDRAAIAAPFDARIDQLEARKQKLETNPSIGDRLKAVAKHGTGGLQAEIEKIDREITATMMAAEHALSDSRVEVQKYEVDKLKDDLSRRQKAEATLNRAEQKASQFDHGLDAPLSAKESQKLAAEVGQAINVRESLKPELSVKEIKAEVKLAEKALSVREKLGPKAGQQGTGGAGGHSV